MNLYAALSLIASLTSAGLSVFVYLKGPKKWVNRAFSLCFLSISIWLLGCFGVACVETQKIALLWDKIYYTSVPVTAFTFVVFIFLILGKRIKKYVIIVGYSIACVLISFIWIPTIYPLFSYAIVRDRHPYKFVDIPGPIWYLFLLYLVVCACYGLYLLSNYYPKATGLRRNQIKYLLIGILLLAITGLSCMLSIFKMFIPPGIEKPLMLIGNFILAYAIIKHRLMDITFTIRATTLRLVSSLIPAVVFLTIGIVFFSLPIMIVMIILTAIASPFLYGPLRRLLRPIIVGGKYDYQRLLKESTKSLITMLDLRQLLDYMVNTISETVGVEKISLFLKEESKRKYEIKASYGLDEEVDNYVLKPNEGIIPWLKQSKAVFIKEEMERALPRRAFENIYGDLRKIGAEFILPLFYKDNLVGVLNLSNKQSGGIYNQTDIDILESLGAEAAVAIENARLHTEVITDELTELYQPKYFELRLREEIEKTKRYRHCLSLMMVEVDNFEEKRYGEKERDKLLKNIAGVVKENLRVGDIACRCGENGFGIILPEITEEPWGNIKERLKKQIKETVEIGERLRRRVKEEELGVTVSIGIASFDGQDREMKRETLIKQAKEVLSQAKKEGNTVKVFYDEKLRKEISTEVLEWIKETEETLVSGEIYVDLVRRTVRVEGKPVKLTPKAFDLLCLLMKKKGRVLNRSFLTESIWGYEYFGTTRTVDSHIKSLRQKLGVEGKKIETIKGIGYKFVEE